MPTACRIHLSVFPLGSSESDRVLAAIKACWLHPYWVSRREADGAWLLSASMEGPLPPGCEAAVLVERLSVAVWSKLGRYARVVADVAVEDADFSLSHELGQTAYRALMRII